MKAVQLIGTILWLVFYGSYMGKAYMEKRRGIFVSRMVMGKKPAGTRIIEGFLAVITFGMAAVQVLSIAFYGKWALVFGKNGGVYSGTGVSAAGAFAAAAGIVYFVSAMRQMKDNWRAGIDESQHTAFVTEGIYRLSRNPAFIGFDLFYIGFGLLFSNGLQLLFTALGIFTLHLQIKEEEKHMKRRYGSAYADYATKVRRYL